MCPKIKIYGSADCHKTNYYKDFLDKKKQSYQFLDVIQNDEAAKELRALYTTGKLNFPTITIGSKKLRNPSKLELEKYLPI